MFESSSEDDFGWVTTSVSSGSRAESPEQDNISLNGYDSDSTMHSKKEIKNEIDIGLETPKSSRKRKLKHVSDDENPKRIKKDNLDVFVKTDECAEIEPVEFYKSQDKDSFMSENSDKIHNKKLKKKKRKHSEATDAEEARENLDFDQSYDEKCNFVVKNEKNKEFYITNEQCNIKNNSMSDSDFQEYKHSDLSNIKHNDSLMIDSSDKTHVKKKKKKKHRIHSDADEADETISNPGLDQSNSKRELNISVNYDSTVEENKISRHSINSDISEIDTKSPQVSIKKKKKKSKKNISEDEDTSEIIAISKPMNNSLKTFLGSPMLNGNVSEDSMTSGARTSIKTDATPKSNKVRFENDVDHNNTIISNFLQANPNLNFIKNKKKRAMITDNDEIWQLKIPIDIDINNLKDNKLTINNNKCKIKVNNETYIGKLDNEETTCVNALFNEKDNYVIKNIKVMGTVQLHKRIPKSHVTLDNLTGDEDRLIPLPETKCRHPLFGSSYKAVMKLPPSIQQKLKQVSEPLEEPKKKKKRKLIENNLENNVTEETFKKKKKKKRRLSESEDDHIPRKKTKLNLNSAKALEKAIEENLFN